MHRKADCQEPCIGSSGQQGVKMLIIFFFLLLLLEGTLRIAFEGEEEEREREKTLFSHKVKITFNI